MITARVFSGKRYAVLGLARSGRATVESLLASGAEVLAWDAREEARTGLDGARFADLLKEDLIGFDGVVVSPGVPLNTHPIKPHADRFGVPVIGDVELFAQARADLPPHKVVGITGTNGKSTTTALVHHILKTAGVPTIMGGNIGLPILAQEPLQEGGVYVLELSSFQIDLTYSLDCDVAVLLNITPDHLDRYESFEAYAASKARLFEMQSDGRVAVFTGGDMPSRKLAKQLANAPHDPAGLMEGLRRGPIAVAVIGGKSRSTDDAFVYASEQADWLSLQGPHNAQNAAAAIAAGHSVGVSPGQVRQALRTFPGLPHRMERVAEISGVAWVNDSKGTNTAASAPALAAFDNIHWIVGGLAKEPGLGECEAELGHVKAAYTIGEAGPAFADLLQGRLPVESCETLDRAVESAARAAVPGDTILLSPACASFDQFRDFEHRGEVFRELVQRLANKAGGSGAGWEGEAA